MKLYRNRLWALAIGCWLAWTGLVPADSEQTITGFRVPEYDVNGRLKSQLKGELATVRKDGSIEITHARIELYKDGAIYLWTTAEKCVYDRNQQTVTSDSAIEMDTDTMQVTGVGFRWNRGEGVARILSQAKVVLKNSKGWFVQEKQTNAQ